MDRTAARSRPTQAIKPSEPPLPDDAGARTSNTTYYADTIHQLGRCCSCRDRGHGVTACQPVHARQRYRMWQLKLHLLSAQGVLQGVSPPRPLRRGFER